jgi:hypothetical protein
MSDAQRVDTWLRVEDVIWTKFDDSDEWVVFSPISAEVQLVNDAAHRLWLLASNSEPRSSQMLVSSLAADVNRPVDDDELRAASSATLAFMDEAGILRLASPDS